MREERRYPALSKAMQARLLWCFIGGGLMKFVQVYTAARYMTLTGEHPLERWKFLPGGMAVLTALCFPLWLSSLPKMLGGLVPACELYTRTTVFLTGWGLRSAFDFLAG